MSIQVEFSTIAEMFDGITKKYSISKKPIYLHKVNGEYREIHYFEYRRDVEYFALGLAALGVKRGDRLAIISENRPEWPITDMAMQTLGAINVPLYPTLTPKQIQYIFEDASIKIAIVSNAFQYNKVLKIQSKIKTLKKIIIMTPKGVTLHKNSMYFSDVIKQGEEFGKKHSGYFLKQIASVKPSNLLTIIYTSGTTGNPKGVMLTHHNMVSNIKASVTMIPITDEDVLLSFLPLCHSFERMAGYYTAMACGATVAYAESVETVAENMLEVRPTIVTTVPRLFERIYSRIMKQIDSQPIVRQKIFWWALDVGKQYAAAKRQGYISPMLKARYRIADQLVFSKLRERVGGRIKFFVSGGAALSKPLGDFFLACGIIIIEGYGLTETSPVLTANSLNDFKFGSVGRPIPGVKIKIAEDGEILAKGPNIMKGYYNNRKATMEAIDKGGWFHTGDIGMFDSEGHLTITDRKKHLFVSSGGKNIAPQPIENIFLQSKYFDQFVLIGDGRMFLTALIAPEFEILREYLLSKGIIELDNTKLIKIDIVRKLFQEEIDRLQKDLPNFERVRRFEILPKSLTIENNEITPSMKVCRGVVEKNYAKIIEKMYASVA